MIARYAERGVWACAVLFVMQMSACLAFDSTTNGAVPAWSAATAALSVGMGIIFFALTIRNTPNW